jgi:hypothetical protein
MATGMITLPIISIVFTVLFVAFILVKYGVPVSLSETYYILPTKLDWMFSAWTGLLALPMGIYWFCVSPDNLKWIPVTVAIALLMIGAADCYKSGPKKEYAARGISQVIQKGDPRKDVNTGAKKMRFIERIAALFRDLKEKFNRKEFFKYGPARLIHYTNSLIAIILTTVYVCITGGAPAIAATCLCYPFAVVAGLKVDGVYNPDYSADVDNKAWIFFMEAVCLGLLFIFIWQ